MHFPNVCITPATDLLAGVFSFKLTAQSLMPAIGKHHQ